MQVPEGQERDYDSLFVASVALAHAHGKCAWFSVFIAVMSAQPAETEAPNAWADLLKALASLTFDKYSERFLTLSTNYRFEGNDGLRVDVLIPRELLSRQVAAPVMVRIHGGFLVSIVYQHDKHKHACRLDT